MINQKILQVLNIRPHESGMVKRLFLVEFFLVSGCAFLFVSANAIFLSVYHIIELPKAFFITGIFLLIFNRLYSNAEHRVTTRQLLYGIIFAGIAVTIFIRIGMMFPALRWMPYVLLIWYNVVYLLTGLIFWGLAAMLFNVRESKRIFTIIGAGDIPAKLLGYLSASLLAPYIGLENMLWIAAAFFITALLFTPKLFDLPQINALELQHHEQPKAYPDQKKNRKGKKIFGANLILNIAGLSLLTFLALILIDFTFLAEVKVKYHTDIELARFLGIFFASGRILAVIVKVTLSSRLISRIGLAGSLLLSPVILFIFTAFILFVSHTNTGFQIFLYLFGIMALFTEILKSTVQEPVFLVLFQPLKASLRLKGHVIAKGYMLGVAMIIVGGLLVLYMRNVPQVSIALFGYVLAGILVLWAGSVFLVKKEYLITLHDALKSGFFRGNELFLNNNMITGLLKKKTESDKPAEAIYAMDLLEKSGYENINDLLTTQLKRKDPVITQYAIDRIIERKHKEALPVIEWLLSTSTDHNVMAKCIQAISQLDTDSKEKLEPYLHSEEISCKRAAIIGLLQCGDLEALLLAGHRLLEYVYSPNDRERIWGAEIIGATGEKGFYKTLIKLINDKNIAVQKQAIHSAGSIQNELLIPSLIEKLKQKETTKSAIGALIKYGDAALNFYKDNKIKDEDVLQAFIRIAGGIDSPKANTFLIDILFAYPEYRTETANQLWEKKYIVENPYYKQLLKLIHTELDHARQISDYENQLTSDDDCIPLKKALQSESDIRITNTFKMLSFLYDRHKINGAMNALILKGNQKASNALEMLELVIPRDIFRKINFLLDTARLPGYPINQKEKKSSQGILKEIVLSDKCIFNNWTKAMAVFFMGKTNDPVLLNFLRELKFPASAFIVEETRLHIISTAIQS